MTKIKQIQLHNFQPYENETIDLHGGINIFIGSSNCGKSAIIRGLRWVTDNKPIGTSFVSYWSIKHEKIDTWVKVFLDNGTVIERKRTENFNGYIINNTEKLEAVGHDVPFRVRELFGLCDYNIQQQFDSPFLLSSSSGEVAKFFNQVIKIDDIDQMLKTVEQKKRRTKTDLAYTEKTVKQYKDDLKELNWVDRVKDVIQVAEILNQQINNDKEWYTNVGTLLYEYRRRKDLYKEIDFSMLMDVFQSTYMLIQEKKEKEEKADTLKKLVEAYFHIKNYIDDYDTGLPGLFSAGQSIIDRVTENNRKKRILSRLVDELAILNDERDRYRDVSKLPGLFEDMERLQNRVERKLARQGVLEALVNDYKKRTGMIVEIEKQLNAIAEKMPDVCPLCGGRLKREDRNE